MDDWYYVENDPGVPFPQLHDPLAGLDEGVAADVACLMEGKAIGTAQLSANVLARDTALRATSQADATMMRTRLRKAATNVSRGMRPLIREDAQGVPRGQVRQVMRALMREWLGGNLTYSQMRIQSAQRLREFYEQMRQLGRTGAGLRALGVDTRIHREEENWFRGAVREELDYWHRFLEQINEGQVQASQVWKRLDNYVRAMRGFFEATRVQALPDNVLVYWIGPKKDDPTICEGCTLMMEWSPFPKSQLPASPRDGCVVSPNALISTRRGRVPISRVEVGDEVFTHRGRWRKVVETFVHRARVEHRYVAVVAPFGRLLVLTDDHEVYTREGWVEAGAAARAGLRVLWHGGQWTEQIREVAVPEMRSAGGRISSADAVLRPDPDELHLHKVGGRAALRQVLGRRGSAAALRVPLSVGVGAGAWSDPGWGGDSSQEWEALGRPAGESGAEVAFGSRRGTQGCSAARGVSTSAIHGRTADVGLCDMRDGVQPLSEKWRGSEVLLTGLPGCELQSRDDEQSVRALQYYVRAQDHGEETVLLSDLLQHLQESGLRDDPGVRLVLEDVLAGGGCSERVEVGQAVLLNSVLCPGEGLYDIAVDEDRSFVADGLIVHNSTPCLTNCRHKVVVRVAKNFNDVIRRANQLDRMRIESRRRPPSRRAQPRDRMVQRLKEAKEDSWHGGSRAAAQERQAAVRAARPGGAASNPFRGEEVPKAPNYRGRIGQMRMESLEEGAVDARRAAILDYFQEHKLPVMVSTITDWLWWDRKIDTSDAVVRGDLAALAKLGLVRSYRRGGGLRWVRVDARTEGVELDEARPSPPGVVRVGRQLYHMRPDGARLDLIPWKPGDNGPGRHKPTYVISASLLQQTRRDFAPGDIGVNPGGWLRLWVGGVRSGYPVDTHPLEVAKMRVALGLSESLEEGAVGDCYEAAFNWIFEHCILNTADRRGDPGIFLVHGEVTGQGPIEGVLYGHAWVEDGDLVIDQSNGRNLRMSRADYYRRGRIGDNLHRYTPEEARRKILATRVYGPWDLKTETGL